MLITERIWAGILSLTYPRVYSTICANGHTSSFAYPLGIPPSGIRWWWVGRAHRHPEDALSAKICATNGHFQLPPFYLHRMDEGKNGSTQNHIWKCLHAFLLFFLTREVGVIICLHSPARGSDSWFCSLIAFRRTSSLLSATVHG